MLHHSGLFGGKVMRGTSIVGCFVLLSGPCSVATAGSLQPLTPWNIAYEESQCTASRDYGSAAKPITLTLIPSVSGTGLRLLFVRNGATATTQEAAELTFGGRKKLETYAFIYGVPATHHRVSMVNVLMKDFLAETAEPSIEIRSASLNVQMSVDQRSQLFAELAKCLKDLREYWNWDGSEIKFSPDSRVDATLPALLSADDYPAIAYNHGLSGRVGMTVLIDQSGNVADCTVDEPSGVGILDATSCSVFEKRAKFQPAIDKQGKPTRSASGTHITWQVK